MFFKSIKINTKILIVNTTDKCFGTNKMCQIMVHFYVCKKHCWSNKK